MAQRIQSSPQSAAKNASRNTGAKQHLIRKGDTLSELALHYKVKLSDLLQANPQIKNPDLIFAGQTLEIPNKINNLKRKKTKSSAKIKPQSSQDRVVSSKDERANAQVARDSVPAHDARLDDKKSLGLTGLLAQNKHVDNNTKTNTNTTTKSSKASAKVKSLKTVQDQLKADQDPKISTKGAAHKLDQALDRFDVNEAEIFRVLGHRSQAEIAQIKTDYKAQHGQSLDKVLASKLDKTELRRAQLLMQGNDTFQPKRDAEMLDIAMKGAGTNESLVLDTLYGKSDQERTEISSAYQKRTGHSLEADIKSEHRGRAEVFALATLKRGKIDDADRLQASMVGLGTDNDALFAALEGKTPKQLTQIKKDFRARYGRKLSAAFDDELSRGDKVRAEALLDKGQVSAADRIREELAGHWSNDGKILEKLEGLKPEQRQLLLSDYEEKYGDLRKDLKEHLSETAFDEADALIERGELSPAQKINRALRGLGTDEDAVFETLKNLHPAQRARITKDYQEKYGQDLREALTSELSGTEQERALRYLDKGQLDLADAIELELRDGSHAEKLHSLLQKAPENERKSLEKTYQQRFGRSAKKALHNVLTGRDQTKADLLLKQGQLKPQQRAELAMQGLGTREEELFAAIADAKPAERQAMRDDAKFMKNLASELGEADYERADLLLKKGQLSREERLHFAMAGYGTRENEISDALKDLSSQERQDLQVRYQKKYGRPLLQDLKSELGQRELWVAEQSLQGPAQSLRERSDRIEMQAARERHSGSLVGRASDGLMNLVSQRGFEVDQSLREYHNSLKELQTTQQADPKSAASLLQNEQRVGARTAEYLQEKQEFAETAGTLAAMGVGAAATAATAGLGAPAAMALVATTTGATKIASSQLIVGDSYELAGSEGAHDFAQGAAIGLASYGMEAISGKLTASIGKQLMHAQGKNVSAMALEKLGQAALKKSGHKLTQTAIKNATQKQLSQIGQKYINANIYRRIVMNAAIDGASGVAWSVPPIAVETIMDDKTVDMEFTDAMKRVFRKSEEAAISGAAGWGVWGASASFGRFVSEAAKARIFITLGKRMSKTANWSDKKILAAAQRALGGQTGKLSHDVLMHTGRQKLYSEIGENVINKTLFNRLVSSAVEESIVRTTTSIPQTLINNLNNHDIWNNGINEAFLHLSQQASENSAKNSTAFAVAHISTDLIKNSQGRDSAAQAGLSTFIWRSISKMWR